MNYCVLVLNGTVNLIVIIGSSTYLYLNSKILGERFTTVIKKLERERIQKFTGTRRIDMSKIDKYLHQFNILVDELNRSNFFWSQIIAINYYVSLTICSIEFLVGMYRQEISCQI